MINKPSRGEIWWVDWSPGRSSEQTGRRPSLIVQNDRANRSLHYDNTIVVAISRSGLPVPFHIQLTPNSENGLTDISYVKCEQIYTITCDRLERFIGRVTPEELGQVDLALRRVLSLA